MQIHSLIILHLKTFTSKNLITNADLSGRFLCFTTRRHRSIAFDDLFIQSFQRCMFGNTGLVQLVRIKMAVGHLQTERPVSGIPFKFAFHTRHFGYHDFRRLNCNGERRLDKPGKQKHINTSETHK